VISTGVTLKKLLPFILLILIAAAGLIYGISLGDPQDMRIEASGL
jgi:hypothetical protein